MGDELRIHQLFERVSDLACKKAEEICTGSDQGNCEPDCTVTGGLNPLNEMLPVFRCGNENCPVRDDDKILRELFGVVVDQALEETGLTEEAEGVEDVTVFRTES